MAFIRASSPLSTPTIIIGGPDRAGHIFKSTIIDNSAVVAVGDVLSVTTESSGNGIVVRRYNAAGDKILGVCVGFGRANGAVVDPDAGTTWTVTVAADNETVAQIYALVDITPFAVWSAPLSAAIHTTAAFGYGRQIEGGTGTSAGQLTESTISATVSAHLGWACLGPRFCKGSANCFVVINFSFYHLWLRKQFQHGEQLSKVLVRRFLSSSIKATSPMSVVSLQ